MLKRLNLLLNRPKKASQKFIKLTVFSLGASSLILSGCVSNQTVSTSIPQTVKTPLLNHAKPVQKTDITPDKFNVELQTDVFHAVIWDEMRNQFDLADEHYGKYEDYLKFYNDRKTHLKRVSERAEPYLYYILTEVEKRNMPYEMALLPIVESGFRPVARSNKKAVGLWQFIPGTADIYDLDRNWWYDGRKDVIKSTHAALDYLQKLYKLNNNDWLLALASYNAGPGNIYKAQRKYRKKHKTQPGIKEYQPNFWEIQEFLPKETQAYVPKLLAVSHIVEYADRFNVDLKPIANQPYFTQVTLEKQVSLGQVAKLANTPKDVLAALNPGYNQPATPPNGPHHLLLPADKAADFSVHLENNQEIFNIQWQKHKIRFGDSLGVIAQKYQTSSKEIKKLNGMKNSKIRAGKTLLIPIPADKAGLVNQKIAKAERSINSQSKSVKTQNSNRLAQSEKHIHVVKPGDSFWKLAKYYNITAKQLANWNNVSIKQPLKQGQKLAIYSNKYGTKIQHTLITGESLWVLAQRYKVSTKEIANWNQISAKKVLQPGMKLTIWTKSKSKKAINYVVKDGDNLWNIAKANQLSARQLALYNKLSLKSLLKAGQIIQIPVKNHKNT